MGCATCNHVYTRYYWTVKGWEEVFKKSHSSQLAGESGSIDTKRITWTPVVDKALTTLGGYRSMMKSSRLSTWVDVGCGDGALVKTATDYGFNAIGLDARLDAVTHIQGQGFKAKKAIL